MTPGDTLAALALAFCCPFCRPRNHIEFPTRRRCCVFDDTSVAQATQATQTSPPSCSAYHLASMSSALDEEAVIRKRYLTQTVSTAANALPPFKKLVKR